MLEAQQIDIHLVLSIDVTRWKCCNRTKFHFSYPLTLYNWEIDYPAVQVAV